MASAALDLLVWLRVQDVHTTSYYETQLRLLNVVFVHSHCNTTAGIKDQNTQLRRSGPADFDNIHHYIGVAEPQVGEKLGFLQMYIYDSEH